MRSWQDPKLQITKSKAPKFFARIRINGKQERFYFGPIVDEKGNSRRREAKAELEKTLAKINHTENNRSSSITFAQFVTKYFRPERERNVEGSTLGNYDYIINKALLPFFGHKALRDIDLVLVREWLNSVSHVAYSTRKAYKNMLSIILNDAERLEMLGRSNPCRWIRAGKKEKKWPKRLLTPEEFLTLYNALPEDIQLIVQIGYTTGLRISEILGLQWEGVDLEHGFVVPTGRVYRTKYKNIQKTEASKRPRALADLKETLRLWRDRHPWTRFVFERDGQYLTYNQVHGRFFYYATACGVHYKGLGFHYFRAVFATMLQQVGASSLETSKYVGHTDLATTGLYTLDDPQRLASLTEKLRDRLRPGKVVTIRKAVGE